MAFERVYAVWDWYDGPVSGVAEVRGRPHHYESSWDDEKQRHSNIFSVTPIDAGTLELVLEEWSIWREWEIAFYCGRATPETHPGHRGQNSRYDELRDAISARISQASAARRRMEGTFRACSHQDPLPEGVMRNLEVQWQDVP